MTEDNLEKLLSERAYHTEHLTAALRAGEQPTVLFGVDQKIVDVSRTYCHLSGHEREDIVGTHLAEHIGGLRTLHRPLDLHGVHVEVTRAKDKPRRLLAEVIYFPIGNGEERHFRGAVYLRTPQIKDRLKDLPSLKQLLHLTKKGEAKIVARDYATNDRLVLGEQVEGLYHQDFLAAVASLYASTDPPVKKLVIDFKDIINCDEAIYADLAEFKRFGAKAKEPFLLSAVHTNETVLKNLESVGFYQISDQK